MNTYMSEQAIFKTIFADDWSKLPPVMQKHYVNRPYTDDISCVEGRLDVMCAGPIKFLAPLFWLMKGVPPVNEKNVPVQVRFESNKNTKEFCFNRMFYFKSKKPYCFKSKMFHTTGNQLVEIMPFGIAWKMSYHWEDECVKLKHRGYAFIIFGRMIPLPLKYLIGEGSAVEKAVDDESFDMQVEIRHPWWGKIYEYKGRFRIKENPC